MAPNIELWHVAVLATTVMWTCYGSIAAFMIFGLLKDRQWATNYLGVATAVIFITCTTSHGMHVMHSLLPAVGTDMVLGTAARRAFGDPRLVAINLFAAVVAVWYLSLRNRFKVVWRGAALFEDMRERQKRAMELNDDVVQNITQAKLHLAQGNREEAIELIEESLEDSKQITTDILGEQGSELGFGPGEIHRPEESNESS